MSPLALPVGFISACRQIAMPSMTPGEVKSGITPARMSDDLPIPLRADTKPKIGGGVLF
jgi:hypothetical protein